MSQVLQLSLDKCLYFLEPWFLHLLSRRENIYLIKLSWGNEYEIALYLCCRIITSDYIIITKGTTYFNNGESSHLPLNQLECSITKAEATHIITILLMRCNKPKVEPEFIKLLGPCCQFTGNRGEAEEQDKWPHRKQIQNMGYIRKLHWILQKGE